MSPAIRTLLVSISLFFFLSSSQILLCLFIYNAYSFYNHGNMGLMDIYATKLVAMPRNIAPEDTRMSDYLHYFASHQYPDNYYVAGTPRHSLKHTLCRPAYT